MKENLKKYLVEFIGAFFLVMTIACTTLSGAEGIIPPIAIGSVLMVMVYAGGHISGGHYNPAVSLAAAMRGALPWSQFLQYSISQIAGAIFAVGMFRLMAADAYVYMLPVQYDVISVLLAEFFFTFALCYVVLQTATTKNTANNSYYGLAIGFTVLAGAFAVGGNYCPGAFNPAVAISASLLGTTVCSSICYTILANLLGGACAALVFKATYTETQE